MSTAETVPLNPASDEEAADPDLNFYNDSINLIESNTQKGKRNSLYIRILYGVSLMVCAGGLSAATWAYSIVRTAPFDEGSKKDLRDGYERNFLGMQSVVVLLLVNILYSGLNFRLALKGRQEILWLLNMLYDLLIWAALIGFGVLNMVEILWDRRLCDGWWGEKETYAKCDIAMFRLLVVEMVAVNLGLLAAVIHFILLVARCSTWKALEMRLRVIEQEEVLMVLLERRKLLVEENEQLEARRRLAAGRPLPAFPVETGGAVNNDAQGETRHSEEDLIDISAEQLANEEEEIPDTSGFTPFASDTGANSSDETTAAPSEQDSPH